MGMLRLYLALSVLCFHTGLAHVPQLKWAESIPLLVNGQEAVLLFYTLSGWLMARLLQTGRYPGWASFWTARWLRLILPYALLAPLLLTLTAFADAFPVWPPPLPVLGLGCNVALLGCDWLGALTPEGTLTAVYERSVFDRTVWNLPHWTLSVELALYALAPLTARGLTPAVLGFAAGVFWHLLDSSGQTTLGYVLFPSALLPFQLGVLRALLPANPAGRAGLVAALTIATLVLVLDQNRGLLLELPLVVLLIPALAGFHARTRWDRAAGDASLALYLSHFPIMQAAHAMMPGTGALRLTLVTLMACLPLLILMPWVVEPRLQTLRRWLMRRLFPDLRRQEAEAGHSPVP